MNDNDGYQGEYGNLYQEVTADVPRVHVEGEGCAGVSGEMDHLLVPHAAGQGPGAHPALARPPRQLMSLATVLELGLTRRGLEQDLDGPPVRLPAQQGGVDAVDHHGALGEALVPAAAQGDAHRQADRQLDARHVGDGQEVVRVGPDGDVQVAAVLGGAGRVHRLRPRLTREAGRADRQLHGAPPRLLS